MSILWTSPAQCRDCYKCLRACPVKAIRVTDNHAQIWEEACILDGSCIAVCPQQAKQSATDLPEVRQLIAAGHSVIASVAPSYLAAYGKAKAARLGGVLRALGFAQVRSTAEAAEPVAEQHFLYGAKVDHPVISSSCPAVVSLVEKHFPKLVDWLAPVVSPMVAHARAIKAQYGSTTKVVFIGPCLAKKAEAGDTGLGGVVSGVLSFQEIVDWAAEVGIEWEQCPADQLIEAPEASRRFPLEGGLGEAVKGKGELPPIPVLTVSGTDSCQEVLTELTQRHSKTSERVVLEMFACPGGCVNGPLMPDRSTELGRRLSMLHALKTPAEGSPKIVSGVGDLLRGFKAVPVPWRDPSEEEIRSILVQIGKRKVEDELNCGACGYETCREKAVAVYNGAAEAQMCIPYMRARAESMASVILEATPNAIVAADTNLRVLFLNPAAERMFGRSSQSLAGRAVTDLMPDDHFVAAIRTGKLLIADEVYEQYKLHTRQYLLHVSDQNLVLGIFIDVTADAKRRQELNQLKETTLTRAQQVIDKQMRVAQEIAGLLGETTAETKVLLSKLIRLMQEDVEANKSGT